MPGWEQYISTRLEPNFDNFREIDLARQVISKPLRHSCLMQNLGEEFEQSRPRPSREERNHVLYLYQ